MKLSIEATRMTRIKPSASIAAKALANELVAAGHDIVDFTAGEPDFDTPEHISAAAYEAAKRGETRYTPTSGTVALRDAIRAKFARDNGLNYDRNQILVANGAKQVINSALTATVEEGDEVIVPAPYWVSYPDIVLLNGGAPVIVPCSQEAGFKLTPEALEGAITAKTKWLILNSPSNPTGAVYSREELIGLGEVLKRHSHVWIMTDDIYEHLIYDGLEYVTLAAAVPQLYDRTLTINGVSKAYAMTGWRIGYAGGPRPLIAAMDKLMSQSTGGAGSVSQAAAREALEGPQDFVESSRRAFEGRRDLIVKLLNSINGTRCLTPNGAFYVYPECGAFMGKSTPHGKRIETDKDLQLYLLEAVKVAVLDGGAYGLSPHLRLSFATSSQRIEEGCRRIAVALEALR
ncbi:Aspartate/prephenate aminotransferase [Paraburkholderia aspalathi]|uniref:aminotransferase class I/II-fold pyridoxal phosphate-dependent enzyme n=1 Tax=Paraburkholderia aspalathi TaxID=1324617 RepID=UPI00190C990E|nr:aminotransferase class I/II-fold pyridoxal phosphate-dependent enzyme [Paraburkholderia aspalathi]MBK3843361.1 aminotransferase class I/II-fold pyridoxal phosphate-dependent enzyme [Paraburkholderia aspalathi]CAE6850831.1 Aspartate/prephenate aminotransferase [Paraburkholderia aspalathi]